MIVKNEADRILRCLESLADVVDCYVIVDTGSTDNTVELIEQWARGNDIPGQVIAGKFRNFAQARNVAIGHALDYSDDWTHLLFVDADMELAGDKRGIHLARNSIGIDAFYVEQRVGSLTDDTVHIVSRQAINNGAVWLGVTYEFMSLPQTRATSRVSGCWFIDHADGAHLEGQAARDVKLLEDELVHETSAFLRRRYRFYLAISYDYAGMPRLARASYLDRALMGGSEDEVYLSRLRAAAIRAAEIDGIGAANEYRAIPMTNGRIEHLYYLAQLYASYEQWANARAALAPALHARRPAGGLFVESWIYDYAALGFYAVCCWHDDARDVARRHWEELLARPSLPEHERQKVLNYLQLKDLAR
jgi:glycosyltransferase involved in cell wall biosynthesis